MVEAELLIGHLRTQVRDLQSLLNYLESRHGVGPEEYGYSGERLRELIAQLRGLECFTLERGATHRLKAEWLN